MLIAGIDPTLNTDPWRYQMHPEIWLLVLGLIFAFVYAVRVVGPKVAPEGQVISRKQIWTFVLMITLLWFASDWPVHDIAEEYLYSMHMIQHMVLSYIVPPLALLATPEWLFRLLIGQGRTYRVVRFLTRPVIAAVVYNLVVLTTHIPGLVNRSAAGGPLHYSLHVLVVSSALMLWTPVCGPAKEWRMSYMAMMLYLFTTSLVPSIPAGWLTFAEGSVYNHYDTPVRVWGMSIFSDQQLAGGIMKLGGSIFMWSIIITIFFRRVMKNFFSEQSYVGGNSIPDSEIVGTESPMMYSDVEEAFSRSRPPTESDTDDKES
jgi:putative membrane protein